MSSSSEDDIVVITTDTSPTMNKQLVRAAILVAVLAGSVATTKQNTTDGMLLLGGYQHELVLIHLLSFSAWFGCSVWVSFVAGLIMFNNLPRHVFGRLQAKLFPAYFLFSAIFMVISIITANALNWGEKKGGLPISLGFILFTILLNLVYFEPETTRIMYLRHKVERRLGTGHEVGILKPKDPQKANDPELKQLSKQFGMLHGISTLLNLGALGVGCYWMNFCTQQIIMASSSWSWSTRPGDTPP